MTMNPDKLDFSDDDRFINDFHREHYYRCQAENERVKSMHFTVEFARAQSQRMDELVRKQEEELRLKRKNSPSIGQKHSDSQAIPDSKDAAK